MMCKKTVPASLAQRITLPFLLLLSMTAVGLAQDPTGRPDPKGKKPPTKKQPVKTDPGPITVTLTVLTTPPESVVIVNGEERGVTNNEGKIQFEKLPLGQYSIEVRKEGYNSIVKGFTAGTESPTVVFKLEPKLDDHIREFNTLVASGRLAGPTSPNAFELLEKLTVTYGDRAEVTTLKSVLVAKLSESITPVVTQTVTNWKITSRESIVKALDAATNALAFKKDDVRVQAQAAYLRGAIALRDWQIASAAPARADNGGQGDASGSVGGPAAARTEFENALKLDETLIAARYQLGVVLLASGDLAGAEAALVRVTQQEPRWAAAYTALGQAYHGAGKFMEATDAFRKASEIEPNSAAAVAGLGLARLMKGEKEGLKDIERAVRLDPNSGLPHMNLAIHFSQSRNKRDWPKAEEEFKKAIQLNTQNLEFQNSAAERMLAEVQKRKR